jgi:hypothetical protein
VKPFKHKPITKRYAVKAVLYRRLGRNAGCSLDYSLEALREMFEFESLGGKGVLFSELRARNGYAFGKWLRDIDISQMCDDIKAGDFCKYEYLTTAIDRLHNTKLMAGIMPAPSFAWNGVKYDTIYQLVRIDQ